MSDIESIIGPELYTHLQEVSNDLKKPKPAIVRIAVRKWLQAYEEGVPLEDILEED